MFAIVFLVAVLLLAPSGAQKPANMKLKQLTVRSFCTLPVLYLYDHTNTNKNYTIGRGQSRTFNAASPGGVKLTQRVQFAYGRPFVTNNIAAIELNGGFLGFDRASPHNNFNYINQEGYIPLNLEMNLWKDKIDGTLVCGDASVRTTFSLAACTLPNTKKVNEKAANGRPYQRCNNNMSPVRNVYNPAACTSDYATYINVNSKWYQPSTGKWISSARSVGYKNFGFKFAKFSDKTLPSTSPTGREGNKAAINFECFEAPCKFPQPANPTCILNQQVSVGNSGFNLCNDLKGAAENVAVMEIIACPELAPCGLSRTGNRCTVPVNNCPFTITGNNGTIGPCGNASESFIPTSGEVYDSSDCLGECAGAFDISCDNGTLLLDAKTSGVRKVGNDQLVCGKNDTETVNFGVSQCVSDCNDKCDNTVHCTGCTACNITRHQRTLADEGVATISCVECDTAASVAAAGYGSVDECCYACLSDAACALPLTSCICASVPVTCPSSSCKDSDKGLLGLLGLLALIPLFLLCCLLLLCCCLMAKKKKKNKAQPLGVPVYPPQAQFAPAYQCSAPFQPQCAVPFEPQCGAPFQPQCDPFQPQCDPCADPFPAQYGHGGYGY